MRLVSYRQNGQTGLGVRRDDGIAPVGGFGTMLALIQAGDTGLEAARRAAQSPALDGEVDIEAPLVGSSKLLFSGVNFISHGSEGATTNVPRMPRFFAKLPSSVIGPDDPIIIPTPESQVDPEVEMALIIGKRARGVKQHDALQYVFGYTAVNDVGARDVQFVDNQEDRGKGYDTFTPMGPHIVTADEIPDPQNAALRLYVNDEERQNDTTASMHWDFAALIESISEFITLYPGDILTSGTPAGVGCFRDPPVYLQPGDVVRVEVGGIGGLSNPVRAGW